MVNLLNDEDWRFNYTEPGLPKHRGRSRHAPENFYSQSAVNQSTTKRIIFSHFDLGRRIWEYIILFVSTIPLFETSFISIFKPDLKFKYFIPFFILDIIYIVDLFISTHTQYLSHGIVITNPEKLAKRYGRVRKILHIITAIPLNWIGIMKHDKILFIILSIPKILRLQRTILAIDVMKRSLIYQNWTSTLIPLFLLLAFFIHFFACIFYFCASIENISQSWIGALGWSYLTPPQLYIVSVYFVMTTILTIGYGDLTPQTSPETILVIFIQLLGVMINAYIISTLVSLLIDPIESNFLQRFDGFVGFLDFKKVPKNIKYDIKDYLQLKWSKNHGADDPEEVYKFIPETIRDKLKRDICSLCFKRVSFMKMSSEKLLVAVANLLKEVSYVPGETILEQGSIQQTLILLNSGLIDISADGTLVATSSCDGGIAMGEQELFIDTPAASTVTAVTYVEGWMITRSTLIHCLAHRPDIRKDLLDNVMIVFPTKYREIKKLLSGRNMKAELERSKELQRLMVKRILEKNKAMEENSYLDDDI